MATGHQKQYDASYGYEDATPDVANRYGRPFTPPRDNYNNYHEEAGPRYTPPIAHGAEGRRSSFQGAAAPPAQYVDSSGINLHDFDNATSLTMGGPRRATMSFGDNLNAPPGFHSGRSRSGSNDSDFLTSLIGNEDVNPANLQRRSSLQEGIYQQNDLMMGVQDPMAEYHAHQRRNSLQEALARNGTSPPEQMHRPQNKWDQQQQHHGGGRRSSLPNTMGQRGSMGYGQGGGGGGGHRYDQGGYGGGYPQQPRAPQPTGPLYTVKLKRNQRSFVLGPRIKSKLVTGTYVKVEADRGEDLGIVIGEASPDSLEIPSRRASYGGFEPPRRNNSGRESRDQPKKILRLATREEVALLATRRQEEDEMHQLCVQKVRERGLDMRIVDAEYQFDRNKLTFYFEAERRVDFRDLVRELFMICGTRIWMCQINTYATSTASRPSNETHEEEDHSEPIIAPPSEFLG
ncbi:unnamed protein product [Cylindrotheca closterium]|uniref:PSP1 C-terminal domain-containing protein n=1 Tax=Cylindrotheca closterium TaxID=2856 RepID=A0AAD2PWA6_9STRA|nr:unnamed protein product [Cylindrotheca closterium]